LHVRQCARQNQEEGDDDDDYGEDDDKDDFDEDEEEEDMFVEEEEEEAGLDWEELEKRAAESDRQKDRERRFDHDGYGGGRRKRGRW